LGLARIEWNLKNFKRAKKLLLDYQRREPLQPQSHYLLGRIYEKEKNFVKACTCYKDALSLGSEALDPLSRLLKISFRLKEKDAIIKYIIAKYREFKKWYTKTERLSLKQRRKNKGWRRVGLKLKILEKRLEGLTKERKN
jgi:predicted Zn-dependent protease